MAKAELVQGNQNLESFQAVVAKLKGAVSELLTFGQNMKEASSTIVSYQGAGLQDQAAEIYAVQAKNIAATEEEFNELFTILNRVINGMEIANQQAERNTLNSSLD